MSEHEHWHCGECGWCGRCVEVIQDALAAAEARIKAGKDAARSLGNKLVERAILDALTGEADDGK